MATSSDDLTKEKSASFLRIIAETARIQSHRDLMLLLQGGVQHFIAHEILLCAWGHAGGSSFEVDVISRLPGVRTARLRDCDIGIALEEMCTHWHRNGKQPMLLADEACECITRSPCRCAPHEAMRRMRSALVHGVSDERDGMVSLYVALNERPVLQGPFMNASLASIDPLIAQIDVAFRKVKPLKLGASAAAAAPGDSLSRREHDIMRWITEGSRNTEIAGRLGISVYTVKTHARHIYKKLGASNRTEAVAKLRQKGFQTGVDAGAHPAGLATGQPRETMMT
jgi:transcriptional regulator EpsA